MHAAAQELNISLVVEASTARGDADSYSRTTLNVFAAEL
jgi:hypothetical protein